MTESLSRISSIFETAKDMTIEAAVSASSRLADTPSSSRPKEISNLLNSRVEKDVLNGMKIVISMISRGEDGLPYFADIVKNVTSANSKVRNLVLIYLTKYAEVEPDKALLSINSIQKLLDNKNPVIRANSIKTLSGIRISTLSPILLVCIKRTVGDRSPLVRATTAVAIAKVYEVDRSMGKQLHTYLAKLLADPDSQVVGAAIKVFCKITDILHNDESKKWSVIHGHFRRFCRLLTEFDEWAQGYAIDLLSNYCRLFIPKPRLYVKSDDQTQMIESEDFSVISEDYEVKYDEDLELFLTCLKPLLYSDSEFVILSIVRSLKALVPVTAFKEFKIAPILCGMINNSSTTQISTFMLQTISTLDKSIFKAHYKQFFPFPKDSTEISTLKFEILSSLVDDTNIKYIIEELKYNALNAVNSKISGEAIKAIGKCSGISKEWNDKILKWALQNIKKTKGSALNELLTVIRYLIQVQQQNNIDGHEKNEQITKIVYNLSLILADEEFNLEPEAKASIIWIIGEFTKESENKIAPDVLRSLLKKFTNETAIVRYQILVLSAKLLSSCLDEVRKINGDDNTEAVAEFKHNNIIGKMFYHTLNLCKFDESYDTRDQSRMLTVLLGSDQDKSQLGSLFLQVPKSVPLFAFSEAKNNHTNKVLLDFFKVPNWANSTTIPSPSIRKEFAIEENKLSLTGIGNDLTSNSISKKIDQLPNTLHSVKSQSYQKGNIQTKYQLQSLDEFFGSEEESEESEESEEESESDEEDSEESESEVESESEEESEQESQQSEGRPFSEEDSDSEADENDAMISDKLH